MKRTLVLGGVVASLALAASTNSARQPAALISYSVTPSGGLCIARPDGTRRVRLTGRANDQSPTWSPNGRNVAFVRTVGTESRIVIADTRGRIVRRFDPARGAADPAWAPDGKRIAYSAGVPMTKIVIASSDGRVLATLATGGSAATSPAWSPNGRQIAYMEQLDVQIDQPGRNMKRIFVINADGTGRRPLVGLAGEPTWAPDGTKIAFVAYPSRFAETGHIAVVNADGTGAHRLTSGSEVESAPSWSPRGRLIAFARGAGSASAVHVVRPDGSGERMLIRSRSYGAFDPAWRPPVALAKARRQACS